MRRLFIFILVIIGGILVNSTVFAATYPNTYSLSVSQSAKTVTLNGSGNDAGKIETISLPSKAKRIQAVKLKVNSIKYVGIVYQKGRSLKVRLYHPNGTKLTTKNVVTRKKNQSFPSFSIASVVLDNRRYIRVRIVKQTKNGINKRFIMKRYQVKPKKKKKLPIKKSKSEIIAKTKPTDQTDSEYWLKLLNFYRKSSGVVPLSRDTELSAACKAHNTYMDIHNVLTHYEESGNEGYTENGAAAGRASVLTSFTIFSEPYDAIEGWINTLYHRLPLLNPAMGNPGFNQRDAETDDNGYSCLYYGTYDSQLQAIEHEPTMYPFPGQTDVAASLTLQETPDPLEPHEDENADWPTGPIITLQFWNNETISSMKTVLKDSSGNTISGYKQLPDDKTNPNYLEQGDTVSFIPKEPLELNTEYTMTMTGKVDSENFSQSWSFTTGN